MARKIKPVTIKILQAMKERGEKIVALTAYDYITARILDDVGVDLILVGDSAANVFAGETTTLGIGLEEMLYHTRIVARAARRALVVGDMPFMSFHLSRGKTVANAGRFLRAGAKAVKVEGAQPIIRTIRYLVQIGIPVMGHLGLLPQSVHQLGGLDLQGTTEKDQERILAEAKLLEQAGCFALVLEKIPAGLGKRITESVRIPTIGIGAGPHCDGQILVIYDMLGLFRKLRPQFVKRYAELNQTIRKAVGRFREEVKAGKFPARKHSF